MDSCTSTTCEPPPQTSDSLTDHADIILNYYHQIFELKHGIDLEIFCDGILVAQVHRIIIASFCQRLHPFIESNNQTLIKIDIPHSFGVSVDDLREIINFLYTGRIILKNKSILKGLEELGCNQILPLLHDVWYSGTCETVVEDKYHSINLMNKLKEFCEEGKFIDCSLRLPDGIGVHCHRRVIAAFSNLVEFSLQEVENTPVIYLEITEMENTSHQAVSQLVEFVYSGKIPSASEDYEKLREASFIFGVNQLSMRLPSTHISTEEAYYNGEEDDYGDSYQSGASTSYFENSNSTPNSARCEVNLSDETEYVQLYNEFVDGPKEPTCRDVLDPTVEFLSKPFNKVKANQYKCPLCSFISPIRGTIHKHIRSIHTQEAPYSCPHCCLAFKVHSNLVRHLRSHSRTKPYKCKACEAEYADKKNMDAHIFREHLGRKPFKCPHNCPKLKFYREETWRKHYQRVHSHLPEIPFSSQLMDETSQDVEFH